MLELFTAENAIALVTLTVLEIVLGIDNIVFIAILTGKLPPEQQAKARRIGLVLAMGSRVALLLALGWIMRLTDPLLELWGHQVSIRDLILMTGGLFLIAKATFEIHDKIENTGDHASARRASVSFRSVVLQVVVLDIVFSLDSVITAVGMAQAVEIMVAAVVIAVGVMLVFSGKISGFIERHPTMKMLALSFLLLIGVMLMAEAFHVHVDKGYIYVAMAFSLAVEVLNMKMRKKMKPQTQTVAA